jgi:hypothetical protein
MRSSSVRTHFRNERHAEQLTGDADRAIVWSRHQPIAGHDGKTALQLVEAGHADAVLAHLEDLRDGAYA